MSIIGIIHIVLLVIIAIKKGIGKAIGIWLRGTLMICVCGLAGSLLGKQFFGNNSTLIGVIAGLGAECFYFKKLFDSTRG